LDLPQEIFTQLAVTIEFTKRVEMRKVIVIVALFLPTGRFTCASRPLVDAAFDLMITCIIRQISGHARKAPILTTVTARAIDSNGMGAKYS
jgi:hypothetical protein